jgi:hypothetical protein
VVEPVRVPPIQFTGDAREKIKGLSGQGFNLGQTWNNSQDSSKFGKTRPYYRGPPPYPPPRGRPAGAAPRGDLQFQYPPVRYDYGYTRKYAAPQNYSQPDLGFY